MFPKMALLLAVLPTFALTAPTAAPGSKHNVYLTHCTPSDCSDWDFDCDPEESTITAAAYFRDGPIPSGSSTRLQKPTTLATTSGYQSTWEGTKRTFRFGRDGTFVTNISAGAKKTAKGDIAGDAVLGDEPFVCFKDGVTEFRVDFEEERFTCVTDYWCPSIDVGTGDEDV